ncbi:MAG TPA: hypothetical protein DCP96_03005 [Lachnospiraceae bacterium]|nr:hypothetical protein [Lachnospiraceae bacterium]
MTAGGRGAGLKGSTTVFFAMTLMSLLSLFFTMAESVRILALNRSADRITETVADSIYSRYLDVLWEDYGILGVDVTGGSDGEGNAYLENYGVVTGDQNGNPLSSKGVNMLRLRTELCQISNDKRLTDDNGAGFIRQAAEKAKTEIVTGFIDDRLEELKQGEAALAKEGEADEMITGGKKALEDAKKESKKEEGSSVDEKKKQSEKEKKAAASKKAHENDLLDEEELKEAVGEEKTKSDYWKGTENPLDTAKAKDKGVLALVIPSEDELSGGEMETDHLVSHRKLATGSGKESDQVSVLDKILFQQYVFEHFNNYVQGATGDGLTYEAEYIICGKETDKANLEGVLGRILAFREVQNLLVLMKDKGKMAEAQAFATALAGATLNPVIIKGVKLGIIGAWAFIESVLDVRALLAGDKIPILKKESEWTSTLRNLPSCLDVHTKAKSCKDGMNYEMYLRLFLTLTSQKNLAYRSMDLIENQICMKDGYDKIQMDHLMYRCDLTYQYEASPLFFTFVPEIPIVVDDLYKYKRERSMSYL